MKLILAAFGALLPPTSASAQTTFANKPALQTAADRWCSDETAALAEHGNIADWDVSRITDMSCLFSAECGGSPTGKSTCNPDIGSWDVSAATTMSDMFWGASSFNKDISSWNTSAVLYMNAMFDGATSFDKDISSWNTSAVLWMGYMFYGASSFNKDISSWNTSAVLDMLGMFAKASAFNKDISSWDVSAATTMSKMFSGASAFDKDLSSWDVSAALRMYDMFFEATSLSDCNKALIHASFAAQTSAWKYSWGSLACPPSPPASPLASPPFPPPPPASPTGVCGDGTALDPTGFCEVVLGSATEVLDGKCEVVLGSATEVVDGKVEIACSDNRRLEEAQEEGAQEAAAASIVDGLLARHPDFVAKLRRANLDEEAIKIMLELGQDFRLPALA